MEEGLQDLIEDYKSDRFSVKISEGIVHKNALFIFQVCKQGQVTARHAFMILILLIIYK